MSRDDDKNSLCLRIMSNHVGSLPPSLHSSTLHLVSIQVYLRESNVVRNPDQSVVSTCHENYLKEPHILCKNDSEAHREKAQQPWSISILQNLLDQVSIRISYINTSQLALGAGSVDNFLSLQNVNSFRLESLQHIINRMLSNKTLLLSAAFTWSKFVKGLNYRDSHSNISFTHQVSSSR